MQEWDQPKARPVYSFALPFIFLALPVAAANEVHNMMCIVFVTCVLQNDRKERTLKQKGRHLTRWKNEKIQKFKRKYYSSRQSKRKIAEHV